MPRPRVTVDDVPVEPYVSGSVICLAFGFSPNYLGKLKRLEGFPYLPLPGGEPRYRISEVEEWMRAVGEEDAERKRPAQVARARAARAAIGKNGKE